MSPNNILGKKESGKDWHVVSKVSKGSAQAHHKGKNKKSQICRDTIFSNSNSNFFSFLVVIPSIG